MLAEEQEFLLEVKGISSAYDGENILEDVSLSFSPGLVYSIIGPNGCGKSTLIKTISSELKPRKGSILLQGKSLAEMTARQIARKMAVLVQEDLSLLSDTTVRQLVSYGRYAYQSFFRKPASEDQEIVEQAMKEARVSDLSERHFTTLSGGERQRSRLAMCLAQKPQILLLDEPTTYLDIAHQLEMMDLIARLNREQKLTVIMVLHDLNHALNYSDQLIFLKDKRVQAQLSPEKALETKAFEEIFHIRTEVLTSHEDGTPVLHARRWEL